MKPSQLAPFCLLLITTACSTLFSADLDQNLVARWTFNDPVFHDKNLKSDVGAHQFRHVRFGDRPSDCSFDGGAVTIEPGALLLCESLSSVATPQLVGSVTIWARLRLEQSTTSDCFTFGLRSLEEPGDWNDMVLAALHRPQPQNASGFVARFLDRDGRLSSGSRHQIIAPGQWTTVALVFNGAERQVSYIVNGKVLAGKQSAATSLATFSNFALGRLKESGGSPAITFDEVRIYSIALAPEWVAEIAPITEPGR